MPLSRAEFLKVCTLAMVGAGLDVSGLGSGLIEASSPAGAAAAEPESLVTKAQLFRKHLQSAFTVRSASGDSVRMVLTQVAERPQTRNVEQFSLIFHAPPGAAVTDGTHTFEHPALGRLELFIVPVGASNRPHSSYQACFSRHVNGRELDAQKLQRSARRSWRT